MADDETVEKAGETGHTDKPKLVAHMLKCQENYIRMFVVHLSADLWSEREPRTCSGKKFMANHNAKVC